MSEEQNENEGSFNLYNVRLKDGSNLLAVIHSTSFDEKSHRVLINHPVKLTYNPEMGAMVREDFLVFSEPDQVYIHKNDILFVNGASEQAVKLYNDIMAEDEEDGDDEDFGGEAPSPTIH